MTKEQSIYESKLRGLQAEVRDLTMQLSRARTDGFRLDLVEAMIMRGELSAQVDNYRCQEKFRTFRAYIDYLYRQLQTQKDAKVKVK